MVDAHVEEALEEGREPGRYLVALKGTENKVETLKGVVVLTHADATEAVAVDVPLIDKGEASPIEPEEGGTTFGLLLVFAFVGGMILNLMPCVLPVISFKILSFIEMAQERAAPRSCSMGPLLQPVWSSLFGCSRVSSSPFRCMATASAGVFSSNSRSLLPSSRRSCWSLASASLASLSWGQR